MIQDKDLISEIVDELIYIPLEDILCIVCTSESPTNIIVYHIFHNRELGISTVNLMVPNKYNLKKGDIVFENKKYKSINTYKSPTFSGTVTTRYVYGNQFICMNYHIEEFSPYLILDNTEANLKIIDEL